MRDTYLLDSPVAQSLYRGICELPICDYHCHLSPKEIYEDQVFANLGQMWLGGDHYKWRLMRQAGVAEAYITGAASWEEKFQKYAQVISLAGGNPLYAWSLLELALYFGIHTPLNETTAKDIYASANQYIQTHGLSPRKLIAQANVAYIATTDAPADSLEYHALLAADTSFPTVVVPSFRPDELFKICAPGFLQELSLLEKRTGLPIDSLDALCQALHLRLAAFVAAGCRFADLGIEQFPQQLHPQAEAAPIFSKVLEGQPITAAEEEVYLGFLYHFLAKACQTYGLTLQLHLAVKRDANSRLTQTCGRDTGSDCVGDAIPCNRLISILDQLQQKDSLPQIILYTLNPQMNAYLAPICGSFPGVVQGAAWWYCDHKRGILDVMESIAETGWFGNFLGMLTDSRSFLSYARHDYFRRILCSLLAKWVQEDDFPPESAARLAADIAYHNVKKRALPQEES